VPMPARPASPRAARRSAVPGRSRSPTRKTWRRVG
jgi:hypothetical protein